MQIIQYRAAWEYLSFEEANSRPATPVFHLELIAKAHGIIEKCLSEITGNNSFSEKILFQCKVLRIQSEIVKSTQDEDSFTLQVFKEKFEELLSLYITLQLENAKLKNKCTVDEKWKEVKHSYSNLKECMEKVAVWMKSCLTNLVSAIYDQFLPF